ncbi:MAG: alpha/beta hydrolase, partial [Chloroflexia bacterium]
QGTPLILIHGGGMIGTSWKSYLGAFAKSYRVIMSDSRGHGQTSNPTGVLSFGLMADDAAAFANALGLEKPLICGYSDGGQVALEIGMRYPELAQAIVIVGSYTELTEASRVWVQGALGDPASAEVDLEKFERDNKDWVAWLKELHGPEKWKALITQIKPMWNAELNYTPEDFARVTAPTLVIQGDRDNFVPVEEANKMYKLLPNAELAIVPGADHEDFAFSPTKVPLFQVLVSDFLERHSGLAG